MGAEYTLLEKNVAETLLMVKAIDFNLGEGWKLKIHEKYPDAPRSPFYIDLGILRSFPRLLESVAYVMTEIKGFSRPDRVSDVPTAATPIVVAISLKTGIPMISPRLDAKTHGMERQIDGIWEPGQRVLIIDDLRTTGGSKEEVIQLYRDKGLIPIAVLVLVDRAGEEGLPVAGLPLFAIYRWSVLLRFYREKGLISEELYDRSSSYPTELQAYLQAQAR